LKGFGISFEIVWKNFKKGVDLISKRSIIYECLKTGQNNSPDFLGQQLAGCYYSSTGTKKILKKSEKVLDTNG